VDDEGLERREATPEMTLKVSPSMRSSNLGRLARNSGPTSLRISETIGTRTTRTMRSRSCGPVLPPFRPPKETCNGKTLNQNSVKSSARTPVSRNAATVTGTGSSSHRFTS